MEMPNRWQGWYIPATFLCILLLLPATVAGFTISATTGPYGTISPSGDVEVQSEASQGFTIQPGSGSLILDVKVDGISVGAVTYYAFTSVDRNHVIQATFTSPTGALYIRSDPSGASISVDGSNSGQTTPGLVTASAGDHQITLHLAGYTDAIFPVTVDAGQTNVVPIRTLEAIPTTTVTTEVTTTVTTPPTTTPPTTTPPTTTVPTTAQTGSIAVSSVPSDANVYIDGIGKGVTPLTVLGVIPGSHTLMVTLNGYSDVVEKIDVIAGAPVQKNFVLVPVTTVPVTTTLPTTTIIGTGSLSLSTSPSGAGVFLDNTARGVTPLTLTGIPSGSHPLRVSLNGYQEVVTTITITAGQTVTRNYALVPLTTAVTTTAVTTSPTTTVSTTKPTTTVTTTQETTTVPTTTQVTTATTTSPTTTVRTGTVTTTTVPPTTEPVILPNTTVPIATTATETTSPTPDETMNATPAVIGTPATPAASLPRLPETMAGMPLYLFILVLVTVPLTLLLYHDSPSLSPDAVVGMPFPKRAFAIVLYLGGAAAFLYALAWFWYDARTIENGTFPALLVFVLTPVTAYLALSSLALTGTVIMDRSPPGLLKWHSGIGSISFLIGALLLLSDVLGRGRSLFFFSVAALITSVVALWQHRKGLPKFPFFPINATGIPPVFTAERQPADRPPVSSSETSIIPPPQEAPLPQEISEKYGDIQLLGIGGIARVFRARRIRDGAQVAVKIPITFDEATGRCFMKEIMAWEGLSHDNIVEISEVNILPVPYVEMEYIRATLADEKKPLSIARSVVIMSGVASGLAYAHDRGIIHRDIKPHNILMTSDGKPKITDWGMSRVKGSCIVPTITGFSLAYAAPEQISPALFGDTDERTDIYQIGVVLYELVTGRIPFMGDDLMKVSDAIVHQDPEPPSRLNPEATLIDGVILRCLAKNPADRYQSVHDLLDEFERILATLGGAI